ncbi:TetR/AcrR family transcriptional regulator [Bacillus timonensis]|uniref:TetR/AcrR family transcriptional regulator n=1 Tax=Bacillus timonensis TaxID=1033734 RepID=UPI000287B3A4|nr:TetR/AcrR family transcriptional regulator [Bacillus timonensis]
MNERKQYVLTKAHQLFMEKGFQATSIQDILDSSGISKGTFYNYFSSKSELFKAVFNSIQIKNEEERNKLLMGENLSNIDIFIKQLDLFFQLNKRNKLYALIEEVLVSNDPDLTQFIKRFQLMQIKWLYSRFLDLFGEDKRQYLLDCAILFSGMLQQSFQYHFFTYGPKVNHEAIIEYCVDRLITLVEDVDKTNSTLLNPELLKTWLPEKSEGEKNFQSEFLLQSNALKKAIMKIHQNEPEKVKYQQLVDFIQDEVMNNKLPRLFLIESLLLSLGMCPELQQTDELIHFSQFLRECVLKQEKTQSN